MLSGEGVGAIILKLGQTPIIQVNFWKTRKKNMLIALTLTLTTFFCGVFNWFILTRLVLMRKHLHFINNIFILMFSVLSFIGPFSMYNFSSVAALHIFNPESSKNEVISKCEKFYWIWIILLTFIPYMNTGLLFIRWKMLSNQLK